MIRKSQTQEFAGLFLRSIRKMQWEQSDIQIVATHPDVPYTHFVLSEVGPTQGYVLYSLEVLYKGRPVFIGSLIIGESLMTLEDTGRLDEILMRLEGHAAPTPPMV